MATKSKKPTKKDYRVISNKKFAETLSPESAAYARLADAIIVKAVEDYKDFVLNNPDRVCKDPSVCAGELIAFFNSNWFEELLYRPKIDPHQVRVFNHIPELEVKVEC